MHENPIRRLRKEKFQLTQMELARLIGTTQATLSRWESGAANPNLDDLKRIRHLAKARAIDWDDAWFFEGAA